MAQVGLIGLLAALRLNKLEDWGDMLLPSLAILVVPLALYLALVLPHWRKMNWALLGQPYARPNAADVF